MEVFALYAGSALVLSAQLRDADGRPVTGYPGTTPLAATVWPGGARAASLAADAYWIDAGNGQVGVTLTAAQTAPLAPGRYQVELALIDADYGLTPGYSWALDVAAAPGLLGAAPAYATFADLPVYGGRAWLDDLQTKADQAGFAGQCGRARSWLDDLILAAAPVRGFAGPPAFPGAFGAYYELGFGRSGPNPWLRAQLDADRLIVRGWVIEATAKKALALIAEGQIGAGESVNQFARLARLFGNQARSVALANSAELADAAGNPYFSIPLGGGSLR